ncbi:MAG TPA: rod shape-determining protein, partial [bacterium]|nr:rod shape-determining protein [bacterium]
RKIFKEVLKKIENHDLKNRCVAGIVLTGGSAELKGIAELLEEITELPVRIGYPILKNNNKIMRQSKYATSIGLLRYIFENEELKYLEYSPRRYDNFMGWVKDLVAQIF